MTEIVDEEWRPVTACSWNECWRWHRRDGSELSQSGRNDRGLGMEGQGRDIIYDGVSPVI
ncbi:hypothetical protein ACRQ5Q_10350 [Bradyrhizobium sp. PMVTL-01]|uniref:hypothetical protein n=1 Tax=Bradyrhizobium sp. PMVTL-01 TaxID=3434999 RepID=UPI003F6F2E94